MRISIENKGYFINRSDFTEALSTYRDEQQTFAGIPLSRIEESVVNIIRRKYPSTEVNHLKKVLFLFVNVQSYSLEYRG
jgi:hypothetical protein